MNELIPYILIAIIFYCIGWLRGHFVGQADQRKESERKHGRIASRQRQDMMFGQVAGRNYP